MKKIIIKKLYDAYLSIYKNKNKNHGMWASVATSDRHREKAYQSDLQSINHPSLSLSLSYDQKRSPSLSLPRSLTLSSILSLHLLGGRAKVAWLSLSPYDPQEQEFNTPRASFSLKSDLLYFLCHFYVLGIICFHSFPELSPSFMGPPSKATIGD